MPPLAIAAGVAAVGGVASAAINSSAAKKASKTQAAAADRQIAANEANRDYQYNLNAPTIQQGDTASNLYAGFLGAGGNTAASTDWGSYVNGNQDALANWNAIRGTQSDTFGGDIAKFGQYHYGQDGSRRDLSAFTTPAQNGSQASAAALDTFRGSTGYQDLLKTGLGSVNANAYASGMGDSGATLKALQDRGTNIANTSAQQWLGNLGNLMSAGGQARGLVAGIGTNTVNASNAATQNAANASSNATLASAGQTSSALQGLLNAGAYAYGSSYQQPQNAYGIAGSNGLY
jgi:hypothetical protein